MATPERLDAIRQEALNSREFPPSMGAVLVVSTFVLSLLIMWGIAGDRFSVIHLTYALIPTIFIALLSFLAHRLGLAYAVIREMAPARSE